MFSWWMDDWMTKIQLITTAAMLQFYVRGQNGSGLIDWVMSPAAWNSQGSHNKIQHQALWGFTATCPQCPSPVANRTLATTLPSSQVPRHAGLLPPRGPTFSSRFPSAESVLLTCLPAPATLLLQPTSGFCCCCSVTPSCPTLCNLMDCSTPGFPVLHCLLEFVQILVHWVGDAIQPSHPLLSPFSSCLQSFPASGSFPMSQLFTSGGLSIGVSASASVLPVNIQSRFLSVFIYTYLCDNWHKVGLSHYQSAGWPCNLSLKQRNFWKEKGCYSQLFQGYKSWDVWPS